MSQRTTIEWATHTWNPVPGWEGFSANAIGEILGPSGNALTPMANDSGHLYVTRGRDSKKLYVHRAVLLAFVGKPGPGQEARHINGNPTDNRLANLCWGTRLEQRDDDRRNGVRRDACRKLTAEQAERIRSSGASSRVLASEYSVSHTTIQKIRRGSRYGQ